MCAYGLSKNTNCKTGMCISSPLDVFLSRKAVITQASEVHGVIVNTG